MRFFTSDHHFYHANVIVYCNRPFSSVEEMNESMVESWNTVVDPTDEVWYLGDFSLSRRGVEVFLPRLNGTKHLVPGNHDHCHPAHAKKPGREQNMRKAYYDYGFETIDLQTSLILFDGAGGYRDVELCHLPYPDDVWDQRYLKWRPERQGNRWLLCGHVHDRWKVKDRMINVGVDVWDFRPVSEAEIMKLIV